MGLKKCKECGREVSSKADACPNCGAKVKRRPLGCGALIVVLVAGGWLASAINPGGGSATKPSAEKPVAKVETPEEKRKRETSEARFQKTALVMRALKQGLKDPSSLEWSAVLADETAKTVCMEYRAKNSMGALVLERVSNVDGRFSQEVSDWNTHCAGRSMFDMTYARHAVN